MKHVMFNAVSCVIIIIIMRSFLGILPGIAAILLLEGWAIHLLLLHFDLLQGKAFSVDDCLTCTFSPKRTVLSTLYGVVYRARSVITKAMILFIKIGDG